MEWTADQKAVIENRKGTLLVSAAAGSGKTAVLVQRILEWVVKEEKDIDEFLVVTFTRAAAAQMRNKIRKALEDLQEQQPDNQHVIKQLSLIHRANITTIDSFCKELVSEHFQELEIDPSMRIMDETEGTLMQEDVLERVLEQAYEKQEKEMLELHQYMNAIRSDENIRKLLRRIQRQADSFPYPFQWLEEARREALVWEEKELEQQPWMQMLIGDIQSMMAEVQNIPRQVCMEYGCLESAWRPNSYEKYCAYFQEECQMLDTIEQADTYSELQHAFDTGSRTYKRFVWKNSGVPESHYLTELWETYSKVKKDAASYVRLSLSEIGEQQQDVSRVLLTILDLTEAFMKEYQKEKLAKNCMDFSDVEHYALAVLAKGMEEGRPVPTEAAEQLQVAYVEILIDEYQDSNDLQEAILTSIARREGQEYSNLFMVGDMKQSIYKFRMARPRLFQEKYEEFSADWEKDTLTKKIELKQNFRSRGVVLEAVNAFFYQIMTKGLGGIEYNGQAALVPGRKFQENEQQTDYRTEVLFLDAFSADFDSTSEEETDGEQESDQEEIDAIELEARLAAERIHELCDSSEPLPVWDEELQAYRPCRYRDIVILLRTIKGWSEVFSRVLMDAEIPVYAESGKGYFDSVEVKNLLCMLAVIDNARDDIALAGVLRSPLVSITDEELAYMRSCCRKGDLWEVLHACVDMEDFDSELKGKLEEFFDRLRIWKEQKTYSTIRELIWNILNTTGYYIYVGAMPNGVRRQGNILKLIEKASAYENTSYRGLFDFLRYIERMKITEQDFGEAVVLGANDNLVRVMTVHKSKGLEFPVVFLCGCGKGFNQRDAEETVLVDADCYLAVNDKHLEEHYYEKTEKRNWMARHMKEENLAEELRILYVAMTRAQEKLILTGMVNSKMAKKNEVYQCLYNRYNEGSPEEPTMDTFDFAALNSLGKYQIAKGDSYLSWMVECIAGIQALNRKQDFLSYRIVTPEELDAPVIKEMIRLRELDALWEERASFSGQKETAEEINHRFQWNYSHPMAATLKGKLSVSEIKKMSQMMDEPEEIDVLPLQEDLEIIKEQEEEKGTEQEDKRISYSSVGEMTGASYGTLVHLVMEKLSFLHKENCELVQQGLQKLRDDHILTEEEYRMVPVKKIYHMINSSLGMRMGRAEQAGRLYREQQFVIGIPMNQIYKDSEEEDLELVQGIIDAYFEEDGELVLMDYKTDRASGEKGAEELIRKYHAQLAYYKRTLEQLTGKPVKETYIYSFSLEEVIPIDV